MAILDGIIYRLKAEAGDVSPHNEIGAGEVLAGATFTLVDRGGGDYAWRVETGVASAALPAHSVIGANNATGLTVAATVKIVSYPATNFAPIIAFSPDNVTLTNGLHLDRESAGNLRVRLNTGPSTSLGAHAAGVERTYVWRIETSSVNALDFLRTWFTTVGRVGTDANVSSAGTNIGGTTVCDTLCLAATDGCVLEIKDLVIWSAEKTNAECAAVADDLRGTLDAGTPSDLSGNVTLDDAVAAGTLGSSASDLSGDIMLDDAVAAGTLGLQPGSVDLVRVCNENDGPHGAITIPIVTFQRASDGVQVLVLQDIELDADSDRTITNAALQAGQWYVVVPFNPDRSKAGVLFKLAY